MVVFGIQYRPRQVIGSHRVTRFSGRLIVPQFLTENDVDGRLQEHEQVLERIRFILQKSISIFQITKNELVCLYAQNS